jgi:amino acid transporter
MDVRQRGEAVVDDQEAVEAVPRRGLRSGAVGLAGLMAQSLGVTGPEISAVVIAAVVASKVAGATPFVYIITGIGALGLAWVYGRFARFVPNAGGTYSIVRAGLGRDIGFVAGWTVMAVGVAFVPALLVAFGFLMESFFSLVAPHATFLSSNWIFWALVGAVVLFAFQYRGVVLSARVLLTLTTIGVGLLTVFAIIVLARGGAHGIAWSSFGPNGNSFHTIALAVGIAMTGFSGFETAVFLAEEAHTPRRQVPIAVLGSVVLAGVFFLLVALAVVTGYGIDAVGVHWATDSGAAVVTISSKYISTTFGEVALLFLAISSFGSALGTANFATRVAFSWGHDGYLPPAFGRTHPRYKSPYVAIIWLAAFVAALFAAGVVWQGAHINGGLTYFSWLLQAGATGILPVYAAVAVGGAVHSRRYGGSLLLDTVLAPVVAFVVVGLAEWSEFTGQSSPIKWAPFFMLALIVIGVGLRLLTRSRTDVKEAEARTELDVTAVGA